MKITCIHSNYESLPEARKMAIGRYLRIEKGQAYLKKGADYQVVGIIFRDDAPWVYVFEDESDDYPIPMPIDYFEVQNLQVPVNWELKMRSFTSGGLSTELLPAAWANFERFYEHLLDGSPEALLIMQKIRSEL